MTHDQLYNEAHKFLEDGEYCGDLGNLVLPALVNVLSQPVTIFTSAENMPVMTLMPISSIVIDSHIIVIVDAEVVRILMAEGQTSQEKAR